MKKISLLFWVVLLGNLLYGQELLFSEAVALPESINEASEEMMPLVSPDGKYLYFSRVYSEKNHGGEYAGDDIWVSSITNDTVYGKPNNHFSQLNNKNNNVVIGFSQNTDTLFLLNIYGVKQEMLPGLSFATHEEGKHKWLDPEVFDDKIKFKGDNYAAYVHNSKKAVALSMEGEGTVGGEDLYLTLLDERGEWGDPIHLGENVNSAGKEISPFLNETMDTLFFSSDGLGGLGDFDIYFTVRLDSTFTIWSDPLNVGAPINSQFYDAYFSLGLNNMCYFTSNRGEKDLSDLYRSKYQYIPAPPLDDTLVSDSLATDSLNSDSLGQGETSIAAVVSVEKKVPDVRAIYYKYNGRNVKWVSKHEKVVLSQIIEILKSDTTLKVELIGFASNEGTEVYNQLLSEDRAKSILNFLVESGIARERFSSKGFGEHFPVGDNKTPGGRSKNRRVEFHFSYE